MTPKEKLHNEWYSLQLQWEANILATYRKATADQITEGIRWYGKAQTDLKTIASDNGLQYETPVLAGMCAVMSPRISWKSNVEGVKRICQAKRSGAPCPVVAGLHSNVKKAWDIANGGSLKQVSGPKVTSFAANLSGDLQRVTVDVWAARVAGLAESDLTLLKGNRYTYLERAYQAVAAEVGFAPAELQAITWIVERGKGE